MRAQTWADVGIELPHGRAGEVDTLCPVCSPTRKKRTARCLSVNTDLGTWCCHHCGWAGALGLNGTNYGAPLRYRITTPAPRRVYATPAPLPEDPLPVPVIQWFASRGIPEPVLTAAGIRWGGGAILFPYLRHGALVNIKHRTFDKRFWMVAGAERILYGFDDIEGADVVCVVEGEVDKLSIDTSGGPPTVSVPDGAPPPDAKHYVSKFSFLDETAMARLRAARTVLIGIDMDAPGERLAEELAQRIGYGACKRVSWHPYKDANEMLIAQGPAAVLAALAAAQPFTVPLDDGAVQKGTRPIRMLPPARGRRCLIELTPVEVSHAR
jgi:twinkle protein